MSHRRSVITGLLALLAVTLLFAVDPPGADWKAVETAIKQGLPKTAIEKLQPIIANAISEKQYAEAIKAIGMKVALEAQKPEEKVTRMRAEIEKAPEPMKPAMNAVVANWFWHYFQNNRWRFMQRTQTDSPPGDDFTTWDLNRILGEIDQQFDKSLADVEILQKTPVASYDDLFEKGNTPDEYRPTVYDVLAQNALEFYSTGEQAATVSQDVFDISADGPIFSTVSDFRDWSPESSDENAPLFKAVQLYQDLIRFHESDDDPSALLDVDLQRLNFGNNHAFGEEKTPRYKAAVKRFAEGHADHPISARARHHLATTVHAEGDWVEAKEIAEVGLLQHPETIGGRRCFNLIQQIEARAAQVTSERVWSDPRQTIDVYYRNVTKVHFRLVKFDFQALLRSNQWQAEQLDQNQQSNLLQRAPVKSWTEELPATEDYQERLQQLSVPADLPKGSYYLIASHNPAFDNTNNQVSFCEVWVSDLALVMRNRFRHGTVEGFVLDASSGEPISGAQVRVWRRDNRNRFVPLPPVRSDKNGLFRFQGADRKQMIVLASHRDSKLSSATYLRPYHNPADKKVRQTTNLFTDRALYRPGQTIQYKGICISSDQNKDNYQTLANRDVTIIFADVNGKEIERLRHRTNEYGSFSGSVTAPRDRLAGRMTLRVDGDPRGQTQVSVEEYKRPKFRVEVERPAEAARLNGNVKVQGKATAYTGAAVNDAKVRWRVVREVRYPGWWYWRCWWMPRKPVASQEIAHGSTRTAADGTFDVDFVARPDASVLEESEPTFHYSVYADVTDTNGETRSGQITVRVGYTALSARMATAQSWLTDEADTVINLTTTTLDGEGQAAKGSVTIHRLKQPDTVQRSSLGGRYYGRGAAADRKPDPTNPNSWALDAVVFESDFETNPGGVGSVSSRLPAGVYRALLETRDRFGKVVKAMLPLQVLDPDAKKLNIKLPQLVASPKSSVEPGESFMAIWGSGYKSARAYIEIEHRGKLLQSFWTDPKSTQVEIRQAVNESMRGGFTFRTTMVRDNRAYFHAQNVTVPWTNKTLKLKWERFVSKLEPAQKETWTAVIEGEDAEKRIAEMVATLYDASLDAYQPHHWQSGFNNVFRREYSQLSLAFENRLKNMRVIHHSWNPANRDGTLSYRHFPSLITQYQTVTMSFGDSGVRSRRSKAMEGMEMAMSMDGAMGEPMARESKVLAATATATRDTGANATDGASGPDLSKVAARKNLNETAFFFPTLISDEEGVVKLQFSMPEALTEWKFLGFAHDRELRGGLLTGTTVTAKELMVQPNPPRFLREGDVVEFTVKVSNQSPTVQKGQVRLTLADARTGDSVDEAVDNVERDKSFEIAAGESMSLSWRLSVPDGLGFLTYKAVGSTGRLSDGEEGFLPVLSRRILVTESLPLPIRGKGTKTFDFERLRKSGDSDSLQNKTLTVQMVSNPSWYAVMALPYLMEYPHECTEQTFNRLYANAIARHIAASDPKIHRVFEQWRGTPALDSPLEKNEDLKSVLLEETPWVRQAESESQARRNVGVLFDDNRLDSETKQTMHKLTQMQLPDGAWPWFPGGRANEYITLYITTGFGRMRHLGVDIDPSAAIRSLAHLDSWATKRYDSIKPKDRHLNHLNTTISFYLYGRSFFLKDQAVAPANQEAFKYWVGQAKEFWLQTGNRQSQAHLAVALKRIGEPDTARAIMASLKERSSSDEEMGMYWRDTEHSWWWYRAPIETQAMMIEAMDEVLNDQAAVEDCKVWLLKQKQTQDWKTTKATADAIYALLLRGSDLLASDALVEISLGGKQVQAKDVEAGTGFFEQRFVESQITPDQGEIKLTKVDDGVAWGSVHWQYLEDMSKLTPYEGTPLKLTKQLFIKKNTTKGPTLVRVKGPVEVGDELVVRIVLRTDRDMEYIHLKDYRGSGTEPVNVLSRYKYQDGLGYYESTRDTASHFFIDYLPKGTYVFEYSTRVQLRGEYQTGVASIQCMYAPEFNSHSESLPLQVK